VSRFPLTLRSQSRTRINNRERSNHLLNRETVTPSSFRCPGLYSYASNYAPCLRYLIYYSTFVPEGSLAMSRYIVPDGCKGYPVLTDRFSLRRQCTCWSFKSTTVQRYRPFRPAVILYGKSRRSTASYCPTSGCQRDSGPVSFASPLNKRHLSCSVWPDSTS
jgi:hypothetical protein